MWKKKRRKVYLFGNNQSNFKCPFKCRYIHSPKPLPVSDPVRMLFRFSLYICSNSLSISSRVCACQWRWSRSLHHVSVCVSLQASVASSESVCVLSVLVIRPNQGSGLKLAVAADRYVGCRGSGVAVLWAAIVIYGRTFWKAARWEKSRDLL